MLKSSVTADANRRGEKGNAPTRTSRFVNRGGAWYFLTREGRAEGPFEEKRHAQEAVEMYIRLAEFRSSDDARKLAERESVQLMLGEAAMGIEVGRLLTVKAAWALDRGEKARKEVSMAKVQVADVLHQAVDTAIQLNGARGYSKDTVLEWIYRYARQARLVDGASEVHKMVLSRRLLEEGVNFWEWE